MNNIEYDSWMPKHQAEAAETLATAKSLAQPIYDKLIGQGYEAVLIEYDGSCDEGNVGDVGAMANADSDEVDILIQEPLLDDLADCALEQLHPGFETNEGGYGRIKIILKTGKITVYHSARVESTVDSTDEI
jgi:hypothetical protein